MKKLKDEQRNWLYMLLMSLSKDPDMFDREDLDMVGSLMHDLGLYYESKGE